MIFEALQSAYKTCHSTETALIRVQNYILCANIDDRKSDILQNYLEVGKTNTKSFDDRAFSIAGPKLWNDLPLEVRQSASVNAFKRALKTHLFKQAYELD